MALRAVRRAALAGALALSSAAAQEGLPALSPGQDYAATLSRLLAEAEDGSAEAKLGLGTLYDLGLGVDRDPAEAFRWYLEAAEGGLSEAQFNVAVMLDSGTGIPQDRQAAAIWYARAALRGNARAQYNLGILFDVGDGVDRNPALARAWLGAAAESLDAARERLAAVEDSPGGRLSAPLVLSAEAQDEDGRTRAEIVWTAAPGGDGARFLVEVVTRRASGGFEAVSETLTDRSAARLDVPSGMPLLLRVSAVGPEDYAPSGWLELPGANDAGTGGETVGPVGRVRFDLPQDDMAALILAAELSASFRAAGLMIAPAAFGGAPPAARVTYAYAADAALAGRIAASLPGSVAAEQAPLAGALPGLVRIVLAGGPAAD